jgi:predicted nucleic acid-binding protein
VSQRRYVETSLLLRVVLEGDEALRPLLLADARYTSALTFAEATRAILRARLSGRLDAGGAIHARRLLAEFERCCEVVPLADEVLHRAGQAFPVEPVRTLDAIHLATLQILAEEFHDVDVASSDERIRDNAKALGLTVLPAAM